MKSKTTTRMPSDIFCNEYALYRGTTFFRLMLLFSEGRRKVEKKRAKNQTNKQKVVLASVMVGKLMLPVLPEEHLGRFVVSSGF